MPGRPPQVNAYLAECGDGGWMLVDGGLNTDEAWAALDAGVRVDQRGDGSVWRCTW